MSTQSFAQQHLYVLWADDSVAVDKMRDALMDELFVQGALLGDVERARLAVADSDVAPAVARRIECHAPLPDALLSLSGASAATRTALEARLGEQVARYAAYSVETCEPLDSQLQHPNEPGERCFGLCQVALLRRPATLNSERWQSIWQDSHTQIAIETQATFGYRQNRVLKALEATAPAVDAIVEEYFPPEAMSSDHAFYGTGGDEKVLAERTTRLIESCARFIDFEHIDVIPMSEYRLR
ncbi:MAG: hypothetical protein AAF385_17730 [Pseudomonadota bacterium]